MSLRERFGAFFASANDGARPYPWQSALIEGVAATGRWPDIAAPTGSGKSAVIDAHVFLVAEHAAGRLAVRPPRRLVLVAPRRVLVDDQFDRAARLAEQLDDAAGIADGSPLADVAGALRALRTSSLSEQEVPPAPLGVWRLRGGVLLDNGWRLEPAACQVICATPQMWGSRLLMRGYGASRRSRNLEAGLLGHDVVAIIDEAHLHERLVDTARTVASHSQQATGLQVVAMSATRDAAPGQAGVTDRDLADPALSRRVRASKRIELLEIEDWTRNAEIEIAARARDAAGLGTVGVFVNDIPTALNVAASLSQDGTVELVCGRLRPADVDRLRQRRPGLLSPAGDSDVDFLVSTQSLEVGVDLDLPAMVTAIAASSALAQRAGRLNRSGSLASSRLTVIAPAGLSGADPGAVRRSGPYEPEDLIDARRWLDRLGGSISPQAVTACPPPLPPRPTLPRLRVTDLETLAMTSHVQYADPDADLYLEDPERELPQIGVIARRYVDLDEDVVRGALTACPPRPHEIATIGLAKSVERIVEAVSDAWVVRASDGEVAALRLAEADRLLPNDTLVVPDGAAVCTAGVVGIREGKGSTGKLDDVLSAGPPDASRDYVIPLGADDVEPIVSTDRILGTRAARNALAVVLDDAGSAELAARLRQHRRLSDLEVTWCGGTAGPVTGLLVIRDMHARAEQVPRVAAAAPVTLDNHQAAVERRMTAIVDALMLDATELPAEQLVLAARTHDEGKRHPRFQQRMGGDEAPLAKPLPGHRPDRGDGWRHEQLSAAYVACACDGDPLVVSVVAAHHGCGRPLFDRGPADVLAGWAECPPGVEDWVLQLFGPYGRYELLRAATQRRIGVHALAWLEGLLRCADMQVSREGS